jgi:hypothetical protein
VRAGPVVAGIPRPRYPWEWSVFHARRRPSPYPGISRLVAPASQRVDVDRGQLVGRRFSGKRSARQEGRQRAGDGPNSSATSWANTGSCGSRGRTSRRYRRPRAEDTMPARRSVSRCEESPAVGRGLARTPGTGSCSAGTGACPRLPVRLPRPQSRRARRWPPIRLPSLKLLAVRCADHFAECAVRTGVAFFRLFR